MSRTPLITTFVAAVLLAIPAGTATWYSHGTYEPDTVYDTANFMRQGPPGLAQNMVYFNGYYSSGELGGANGAWVNPNVGALHTNLDPPGTTYMEAILGVWVDCNGDGYVGMAETAVREYDARLLLDTSICPPTAGPRTSWIAGAHNYNGWVTEYIPIGSNETKLADTRIYKDVDAMVWADVGRPNDPANPPDRPCHNRARGDSQTTGGIIYALDCQGQGYRVATVVSGIPIDTGLRVPIVQTINQVDGMTGLGIGFGSDPRTSSSPLNQPTFGSDHSDNSAVYLQDCDADPILQTDSSPPGSNLDNLVILRPLPSNPVNSNVFSWTVPGTFNATSETVFAPNDTWGPDSSSNCNYEDDAGQDFYILLESDVDEPPYNGKDAAGTNLRFNTATRGSLPSNFYPTNSNSGSGSAMVPTDFGIEMLGISCTASSCMQSNWLGAFWRYQPRVVDVKYDLTQTPPTASADIPRATYYTYYAHVGPATTARGLSLPGGSDVYGGAQCGHHTSGRHAGWNCDVAAWYRTKGGAYPNVPFPLAKVGQRYELRDVDCFDGYVGGPTNDAGIGLATAYYGAAPCLR